MFFNHSRCESAKFALEMELYGLGVKLDTANRQLKEAQEAEARSWATVHAQASYIRHLESHIETLNEALGKDCR